MKKKLAIIGASYLQEPVILRAKQLGIETHVFAWQVGDIGETLADFFYPISIVEKKEILHKCQEIKIDGICTIASDLATTTVCYVAEKMGLAGNSIQTSLVSTNKHEMRKCFEKNGDPSPKSRLVTSVDELDEIEMIYPLIVKPTDRSGSRGIYKVECWDGLKDAIERAKEQSFEKKVLVEEFVKGKEYSVEYISYNGQHNFLAMTEKFTTGAPNFIEIGHMQPSGMEENLIEFRKVQQTVEHALDSLGITVGASHTELKIDANGNLKIIEIGARMGGDFIGSHLVKLTTTNDFVELVIRCALGEEPDIQQKKCQNVAAVKFAFSEEDCMFIKQFAFEHSDKLIQYHVDSKRDTAVTDSSTRWGYCLAVFDSREEANKLFQLK